jgi:AraC family ethanolamine operon transcriptional activator
LHRAFVDQIGISPMGYVRRERLHALRRFLLQAEREETTVSDAARIHGFRHLGRLSNLYRDAFGESPSETLVK